MEESEVKEMNCRLSGDKSLNVSVGDEEENEQIDFLVDKSQNLEASLERRQESAYRAKIMQQCLQQLNEREQYIIKNRMLTDTPLTLEDIGVKFQVSRERIRQIEKSAFDKLRTLVMVAINSKK